MRLISMCLVVWINRIVASGLETTHMIFTSVLCIVQEWQCSVQLLLLALLALISLRMWRRIQELWTQSSTQSCWKHFCAVSHILISKICCGYNKVEQQLSQYKFPCKFTGQCFPADSFLILGTSPGQPTRMILQYQTTSCGAVLRAKYMKHILPILMT